MNTPTQTPSLPARTGLPTWAWIMLGAVLGGVVIGVIGWHEITQAADADPDWGEGGIMAMMVLYVLEAVVVMVGAVLGCGVTALGLWLRRRKKRG